MAVKQTAGRDTLGEFAPKFAQLNDDVLFGEVWSREQALSLRDRSLVTITCLMAQGLVDSSFQYHLMTAKQNGITRIEIAEILTHAAFYAGWPKAWAAFRMAKDVWAEPEAANAKEQHLPQQLAYSPCKERRRTDFNLHQRQRLLSGMGKRSTGTASRGCCQYSGWGKTLARSSL